MLVAGCVKDDAGEIPCCDVKKTSTGSQRTLAAALVKLNCPDIPPPVRDEGEVPPPYSQYDLSHHAKELRLAKPASACGLDKPQPTTCISRGQMLIRFNQAYNASGVPDLRRMARTGKRHHFTDNIHSQILRGSTFSQA